MAKREETSRERSASNRTASLVRVTVCTKLEISIRAEKDALAGEPLLKKEREWWWPNILGRVNT